MAVERLVHEQEGVQMETLHTKIAMTNLSRAKVIPVQVNRVRMRNEHKSIDQE